MALNAYLSLTGQKQGQIKGNITQKGREGQIAVYAFNHGIVSPRDSASGLPTGKRMHQPLVITKELDKSTPLLMNALVNNENLKDAVLSFYGQSGKAGLESLMYIIRLTNVSISEIEQEMELVKIEPGKTLPVLEHVSFVYQKIEVTWLDGAITAMDDWDQQK